MPDTDRETPDVEALRALLDAATPRPWEAAQGASGGWWIESPYTATVADIDIDSLNPDHDAALIAAAVNALPDLLDRLEAAERLRAGVEASGGAMIAVERQRQIDSEGYTPSHDVEHSDGDLARAAVCYATPPGGRPILPVRKPLPPRMWPWDESYWKPTPDDRVRELVKAGALIAAEIDRLLADTEETR